MAKDVAIVDFSNAKERQMALSFLKGLKGKHWFDVRKCKNQRSLNANAYYWSTVLPAVARGLMEAWGERLTVDEVHEWLKTKYLFKPVVDRKTGEVKGRCPGSSAALDTEEFGVYLDNVIKFAAEQLEVEVPAPTKASPRPLKQSA